MGRRARLSRDAPGGSESAGASSALAAGWPTSLTAHTAAALAPAFRAAPFAKCRALLVAHVGGALPRLCPPVIPRGGTLFGRHRLQFRTAGVSRRPALVRRHPLYFSATSCAFFFGQ
ncbi:MAG: hypothetical protein CMQ24_01805, partial [Gammaproteobacteria bacterium]|nr:hypothetical protein [Gammaproteobacteria bacterium]